MIDLLLTHGTVITVDAERRVLDDGAVAIDGGRIVAVGPAEEVLAAHPEARETLDCRGRAVLPGLIDAHGHGGHCLPRTIALDSPSSWMPRITQMYFEDTTPAFWYAEGRLSALERLRFGVTCGVSVIGSQPRPDDPEFAGSHARAYAEVGLREVVAVGPSGQPWPRRVGRWDTGERVYREVSLDDMLAGTEAVIEAWHGAANGRIRVFVTPFTIVPSLPTGGPAAPDQATELTAADREQSRKVRELASRHGTRIHSDAFGGQILLAAARDEHALLGPDVHLQHCLGISPEEVAIVAETDTRIAHSPWVGGQLLGRLPVIELMEAGATVAISSDGSAPSSSFDLFEMMRRTKMIQVMQLRDPQVLPPGKLLEMVTIDAARTLGAEDELGSLEVGKRGDAIVLDMTQPHLVPSYMDVANIVLRASGRDVESVVVDGAVVLREREVLTVDEAEALDQARAEGEAMVARAGLEPYITPPTWKAVRQTYLTPPNERSAD